MWWNLQEAIQLLSIQCCSLQKPHVMVDYGQTLRVATDLNTRLWRLRIKEGQTAFHHSLLVLLTDFQPKLTVMNRWTVILNHGLRRLKNTDGRELLSMRPVATHMNRILPKVRDRMSEKMEQAPPMWRTTLGMKLQQILQQWQKVKLSNMSPWTCTYWRTLQMSEKQFTKYCGLKKADTTNFCSLTKRTLQMFVVLKSRHQ